MIKLSTTSASPRGFSLIELLIAMVLMSVGVMATIAMQFISLGGYTASREVTGATEMARQVEARLRAEAMAWNGAMAPSTVDEVYNDGRGSAFLADIANAGGGWVRLYDQPVNQRMRPDDGAARFCVFGSAEQLQEGGIAQPYLQVRLAIVYPGANGAFPGQDGGNLNGRCDAIDAGLLIPGDEDLKLELEGLRASYFASAIRPR
ncbi:prepilin-type N-terminal cleavage/methylation domain-containing protein [Lujinxingia vulgaris]|uniref:Prepilin-type N-terminal cleavage/methylation domain-containing protein n=1 Tax=Lujinxingia vulgaris TaxID=2600176 RepID=A0A5C6X6X0_9DELT|nr:prepilin-type N-terminal cleavage/methylation domain-containing protein [Lujinxingia vulgaris]TXD35439.1 prepilin-type N-terminal cleavage/methylation domain-containing protein [Lujinxingia vulgaris]